MNTKAQIAAEASIQEAARNRSKERIIITVLIVLIIVTIALSLTVGRYAVPLEQIFQILGQRLSGRGVSAENTEANLVLFIIRLPRIFLSVMVGAALAASGASYQGLFKNPMVSPDILGVTGAAAVGTSIGILFGFPTVLTYLMSFSFGIGAVLLVVGLAKVIGRGNGKLLIMVLTGTVVSSIFTSISSFIKIIADPEGILPGLIFWLLGSFSRASSYRNIFVLSAAMVIGAVPLLILRWRMNVLSFGEEEAQAMGVNTKRMRFIIIGCATLLTASSVCLCGNIAWMGLIMPHLARQFVGPNYRILLPTAMLGGGLFMLIVDNIARVIIPGELPVGIITSLIGAPIFIFMLYKGRRDWG